MAEITEDIEVAAARLRAGELVAIPTETVYGLAGNALDARAVAAIFDVKQRPAFDPLIVHVADRASASACVTSFPEPLAALADAFWPGPLTLLLERTGIVPDLVTSGLPRVAIRVPAHPLTRALIASLDFPLAAPSANPFGYISPTRPEHVAAQLGDRISLILDGGPCEIGLESTIVGVEEDQIVVYRLGGLAVGEIEAVVGPVEVRSHSASNPAAPGLLARHYSPGTRLVIGSRSDPLPDPDRAAVLAFAEPWADVTSDRQRILSPTGDVIEAAANLFLAMRELDALDVDIIMAELLPEEGLGRAINDRLRRAAARG